MRAITWTRTGGAPNGAVRYTNPESSAYITRTVRGWEILRPLLTADEGMAYLDVPQRTLRDAKAIAQAWILTHHRPMVEAAETLAYELTNTAPQIGPWTRRQVASGTEFYARDGRVVVKRIWWWKPGFKNVQSSGWAVLVNGTEEGAAHSTAAKAIEWAELRGVARRIDRALS